MIKYIHDLKELPDLFEKLKYETERYGASYTAMLFDLNDPSYYDEFWEFLLKYLRISDTVFTFSKKKILVILEETTVRWALILNNRLREKIKEKWFTYEFHCAAVQGNFISNVDKLKRKLKKRIDKAKEMKTNECIFTLTRLA